MGSSDEFQAATWVGLMSSTVTLMEGQLDAIMAMVGPPT